jgi:hypothetical protein
MLIVEISIAKDKSKSAALNQVISKLCCSLSQTSLKISKLWTKASTVVEILKYAAGLGPVRLTSPIAQGSVNTAPIKP